MKGNIMEYKGYHTKLEVDITSYKVRGKIEGINDFVDFEGNDVRSAEKEFHEAVDDYLAFCAEVGKEPDKEYKGTFNVRISPELHKKLAIYANKNDMTLNATVEKAIETYVNGSITDTQLRQTVGILTKVFGTEDTFSGNNVSVRAESNIIPFKKLEIHYNKKEAAQ